MPWLIPVAAAAIGAGGAIIAGNNAADAAKSAAGAQTASDQAAIAEQQREFDTNQSNLAPWLTAGRSALNAQLQLLGLGGLTGLPGGPPSVTGINPNAPTSTATSSIGAPTLGGVNYEAFLAANPDIAAWAAQGHGDPSLPPGSQTPQQAAAYWIQQHQALGDEPRALQANLPTYSAADVTAAQQQAAAAQAASTPQAQQQAAIDALKGSPLYQSLYRNGQDAILAAGSATGGLRGGNMQRSLANFGSDTLASVIQQQLANLGGISGQGVNTGGALGSLNNGTANAISGLLTQQGGAQAGGILASSGFQNNALANALSQLSSGIGQSYAAYKAQSGPVDPYQAGVI